MLNYNIMNNIHTNGIHTYINCKRKLLHCSETINFNKICLRKKHAPKYEYAHKNISTDNEAARKHKRKLIHYA
jgi:protein associated with RNAse G/E